MSAIILQFPPRLGFGQRLAATGSAPDYGCAIPAAFDTKGMADYLDTTKAPVTLGSATAPTKHF